MSVPTVTATTATTSATSVTEAATIPATSSGLSSTASTITTSDQNGDQFTAWVSRARDSIRNCFAWVNNWLIRLPHIGTLFMNDAQFIAFNDNRLAVQIRTMLGVNGGSTLTPIPTLDEVGFALTLFTQLRTPVSKMAVFHAVLTAGYLTDDMPRQFYANLPVEMQNEFKRQIWVANNEQDNGHGFGYGDYVVANELCSQIARDASALQYFTLLAALPDSILTILPTSTTAATTS